MTYDILVVYIVKQTKEVIPSISSHSVVCYMTTSNPLHHDNKLLSSTSITATDCLYHYGKYKNKYLYTKYDC